MLLSLPRTTEFKQKETRAIAAGSQDRRYTGYSNRSPVVAGILVGLPHPADERQQDLVAKNGYCASMSLSSFEEEAHDLEVMALRLWSSRLNLAQSSTQYISKGSRDGRSLSPRIFVYILCESMTAPSSSRFQDTSSHILRAVAEQAI